MCRYLTIELQKLQALEKRKELKENYSDKGMWKQGEKGKALNVRETYKVENDRVFDEEDVPLKTKQICHVSSTRT